MPRRATHSKKGGVRSAKKPVEDEEVEGEEIPSGKSSRNKESSEGERSRRSSTAAQTAASVAESRVTRTRTSRQDSSPSDNRRASGRDVEMPVARVRSSRRSAGRVNYKESDGEEEASTPKNEDEFDSNDEFDDSDSDEKSLPKSKRGAKTPAKSRAAGRAKKSKGRGGGRGRPAKRKMSEEEEEFDDPEPIDVSDEDEDTSSKKSKIKGGDKAEGGSKAESESSKGESAGKHGRKSSRGASRSFKSESPVNKRPSRNKQVKKYTEVDEDFDEQEEAAEVKSEDVKKVDQEMKGTSRKRKRESEVEPNKRPKKEHKSADVSQEKEVTSDLSPDSKEEQKSSDDKEADLSCEPMDVDESVSDSEPEKVEKKSEERKPSPAKDGKETDKPATSTSTDTSSPKKEESHPSEPNHVQNSDAQKVNTLGEAAKVGSSSPEKKDNTPGVIRSVEKETASSMAAERNSDSKRTSKVENTFLSKGSDVSMNGEGDKPRESLVTDKGYHFQNSSAPRANGEPEHISAGQKPLIHSDREYVSNKSLGVDFLRGLKGNSVRFGFASYNLSSVASPKEKLASALDKDVSIVCLQNVSKSLFHDTLESYFEANGFKAVVNWLSNYENHLITFYKTSVFKVKKIEQTSIQKLIQKKLDSSNLEENEKSAVAECFDRCGHVLFAHLEFGNEENASLTVANAKIPTSAAGLHALQLVCLNQELAELSEQSSTRVLLCGEFNAPDTEIPYQLLRHGRPIDEILQDFKGETESMQNASLLKLLKNIAHRPSVKLSSCYALVLGRELTIPESKTTSPDLLWVSADGIHTVGIVDLPLNYRERLSQGQVPLKADIAVTFPFPPKAPV